jgi:hypothetical protein
MVYENLNQIAEAANLTVAELLYYAEREPQLKQAISGIPLGKPDSGIPLRPSELDCVLKRELASFGSDE